MFSMNVCMYILSEWPILKFKQTFWTLRNIHIDIVSVLKKQYNKAEYTYIMSMTELTRFVIYQFKFKYVFENFKQFNRFSRKY